MICLTNWRDFEMTITEKLTISLVIWLIRYLNRYRVTDAELFTELEALDEAVWEMEDSK
jgi:hypothetical protein